MVDGTVIELELTRAADSLADSGIMPQGVDGIGDVGLDLGGGEDDGAMGVVLGDKRDVKLRHGFEDYAGRGAW